MSLVLQRTCIDDGNSSSGLRGSALRLLTATLWVRSLLKTQDGARATVDPAVLVEEVAALADNEASRRRISLKVAVANRLPKIKGNETQLQQCLLNLFANSFDAIDRSHPERREVEFSGKMRVRLYCSRG
jgi:signal transduction histidine kinase